MTFIFQIVMSLAAVSFLIPAPAAGQSFSYLYRLADFTGTVPYSEVDLYVDRSVDEIYATVRNSVRIFNGSGMQVYRFDHDPTEGLIYDLAVDEEGDILLLTVDHSVAGANPSWSITRCDFRGETLERIRVTGIPAEYQPFLPNQMFYREGRFILVSHNRLRVVVADRTGGFRQLYDLAAWIGVEEDRRAENDITGFDLDPEGNFLFTIATQFQAFVVSPAGTVRSFGRPGSVPGSFGVVAGIAGDEHGRVFVADKLRNVVMVFDDDLEFVSEFGTRTGGRSALVRPTDLVSGGEGRIYVTQARNRGVAVFQVRFPEIENRSEGATQARGGENGNSHSNAIGGMAGTEISNVPGQGLKAPIEATSGWD